MEPSFEAWQLSCTSTAAWCLGNNCTSWPHNAAPSSSSSRDILGDTATSWIDSVKKSLLCKIAWKEGLMCEHETMQPYWFRANFHPDHLTQVAQTTRDMLHCGILSNTWQMFGMKLAQHPRKWVLLHPNENVVERDTGHEKRLAIFIPNEFGQPSVHTNCSQHKCFPVACLVPEVQPRARSRTLFCLYVGR